MLKRIPEVCSSGSKTVNYSILFYIVTSGIVILTSEA